MAASGLAHALALAGGLVLVVLSAFSLIVLALLVRYWGRGQLTGRRAREIIRMMLRDLSRILTGRIYRE